MPMNAFPSVMMTVMEATTVDPVPAANLVTAAVNGLCMAKGRLRRKSEHHHVPMNAFPSVMMTVMEATTVDPVPAANLVTAAVNGLCMAKEMLLWSNWMCFSAGRG